MTLRRYTGLSPKRVSKDSKYSVTAEGEIKLEFHESQRVRFLLVTGSHVRLAEMVNDAKVEHTGQRGGAFYLNEFGDVLVPDGAGGPCFWVGHYEDTLEFTDEDSGLFVSPCAPVGLQPGGIWKGPHVGIQYKLKAGGTEVSFELVNGRRTEEVYLSDHVGPSAATRLAKRLAGVKGNGGGRFFINEKSEMFAPVGTAGWEWLYLGHLGEDSWFHPPEGFERP